MNKEMSTISFPIKLLPLNSIITHQRQIRNKKNRRSILLSQPYPSRWTWNKNNSLVSINKFIIVKTFKLSSNQRKNLKSQLLNSHIKQAKAKSFPIRSSISLKIYPIKRKKPTNPELPLSQKKLCSNQKWNKLKISKMYP